MSPRTAHFDAEYRTPPPPWIEARVRYRKDDPAVHPKEFRERRLRAEEIALHVYPKEFVKGTGELLGAQSNKRDRVVVKPGIADEAVEPAERLDRLGHGALIVFQARDVANDRHDAGSEMILESGEVLR